MAIKVQFFLLGIETVSKNILKHNKNKFVYTKEAALPLFAKGYAYENKGAQEFSALFNR